MRLGDLDQRRVAVEQLDHVVGHVRSHELGQLAAEQRDAAAHPGQVLRDRVRGRAPEHDRIELPGPPGRRPVQRVSRHVVEHPGVVAGLRRHQPELGDRHLVVGVGLRIAEGAAARALLGLRVGPAHRRIDDDRAREPVAPARGGLDADDPAHAVADEERRAHDARIARDRHHLFGPEVASVLAPPAAVAVAGEIERGDVVLRRQQRRDEAPPVRVRGAAVHQHDPGLAALAPAQVVDRAGLDLDLRFVRLVCERAPEPVRRFNQARTSCAARDRARRAAPPA